MKKLFFLSCIAIIAASACHTKRITCDEGELSVSVAGYTRAELDSAKVIRFTKNGLFDSPIDTFGVMTEWNETHDTASIRSVPITPASSGYAPFLSSEYDYQVFVPSATRTYYISGITLAGNTHQDITDTWGSQVLHVCYNNVASCKIDGQATTVDQKGPAPELGKVCISK